MVSKKLLERNIFLNYIVSSLMWGRFYIPVLALFYIANEVPMEQFTIIMSVFFLTSIVLEVPSGVVADLLGYKKTLLISRSLYVVEILILCFSKGFWPFLIAKVISGIGVSLTSGTTSALLYDSLKRLRRTKDHKKISGLTFTFSMFSQAVFFVVGAYLFKLNHKLPAYASLPFIVLGLLLSFFLTEPYSKKAKLTIKHSFNHLKDGLRLFVNNKYLIYLAIFSIALAPAKQVTMIVSSKFLEVISIPVAIIGLISFAFSSIMALSSKKAHLLEGLIGEKNSFGLIQTIYVVALVGMMLLIPYFGLIFYLMIALAIGLQTVIINHYVNEHVETKHRATMISINNLLNSFLVFLILPVFGFVSKESWFWAFAIILATALVGIISSSIYRMRKRIHF